jgi:hypothetical protein
MRLGRTVSRMILLYFEDFLPYSALLFREKHPKSLDRENFNTEDIGAKGK